MRVLMVTNSYGPVVGGVEASIRLFRRGLQEAGHEVVVVAPERSDYQDDEPYVFRLPSISLPGKRIDGSLPLPSRGTLEVIIRGVQPDVIHSHHPFLLGDTAAELAAEVGVPLVYTFHTKYSYYAAEHFWMVSGLADALVDDLLARYLRKCDLVIAPTPSIRDLIRGLDAEVAVAVVPTPVDLSAFADLRPAEFYRRLAREDAELLVYVGRITLEKNLHFLMRAFATVARSRPQARLVLVGKGLEQSKLEKTVASLGIDDRVEFAGPIAHEDVPHVMAAADLLVFASLSETQGLVLVEALAAGTPVVAVDASGTTDVLGEGGGIVVDEDENQFAAAVLGLLEHPAERERLAAEAREAAKRFGIRPTAEALVAAYRTLLGAGAVARTAATPAR